MWEICLGIGSNIGDAADNLVRAVRAVGNNIRGINISGVSRVYLTSPVGNPDQPYFLNCAVLIETGNTAAAFPARHGPFADGMLNAVKEIESNLGRKKETARNMPRIIDIDILFVYDNISKALILSDTPELTLPHPEIFNRKFVLFPMADLAGGFSPGNPFGGGAIKKALASLERSNTGAFQEISVYGKFDAGLSAIVRRPGRALR